MTEKIANYLHIDSSTVSSILREKAHLDYLLQSKNLSEEEIIQIQKDFRKALKIPENQPPDSARTPNHLTEDEYLYCLCVSSVYGRGIESSLARYFNKDKSFLSNGVKSAKKQGKIKRALDRFQLLSNEEIKIIGLNKFKEWNIQSYSKRNIPIRENYTRWRY